LNHDPDTRDRTSVNPLEQFRWTANDEKMAMVPRAAAVSFAMLESPHHQLGHQFWLREAKRGAEWRGL